MTKVLLIDDDKKHSELLQAYFKRFGINLVCAYEAESGFRLLNREDPDLLLLDVMLPGKDGFEICREVRKNSNIPIIMLTARGEVIDRVSVLDSVSISRPSNDSVPPLAAVASTRLSRACTRATSSRGSKGLPM